MTRRDASRQPYRGVFVLALPCDCGKRGYPNRQDAKKVLKEMRRQGKLRDTARVDVYQCEQRPEFWHVGHTTIVAANLNDPRIHRLDER